MSPKDNLKARIFDVLLHDGTIQDVAGVAYEISGHPIVLLAPDHSVLAQVPEMSIGDPLYDMMITEKAIPYEYYKEFLSRGLLDGSKWSNRPYYLNQGTHAKSPRLIRSVIKNETFLGSALMVFKEGETPSPIDYTIIDIVGDSIHLFSTGNYLRTLPDNTVSVPFIRELFKGSRNTYELIKPMLSKMKIDENKNCYVMVISDASVPKHMLPLLYRQLRTNIRDKLILIDGNNIYVLFYNVVESWKDEDFEKRIKELTSCFQDFGCICGISEPFKMIYQARRYKLQAQKALEIGSMVTPGSGIHFFSKLFNYSIAQCLCSTENFAVYLHPAAEILLKYDKKNMTEYYHTLIVYLEEFGNTAIAAEKLHIHKNSLTYRLKKIHSICNIDIHDPLICYQFLCTDYIYRLQSLKSDNS